MNGIIIEGLSGAGKSTIINILNARLVPGNQHHSAVKVFLENETLGELVTEMRNTRISDAQRCKRLEVLCPLIEEAIHDKKFVLLERFHLSYFALMPDWGLVQEIDNFLASLNIGMALLHYPDKMITSRCFYRPELPNADVENDLINWYGTKEKALAAFTASQQNRLNAISLSRLHSLTIDTGEKDWPAYTEQIIRFINGSNLH